MITSSTAEFAEFIATNRTATRVYLAGRADGYVHGYADGHQHAGDAAERAARAYYAMDASEAHTRAYSKAAADALTVPRMLTRSTPAASLKPAPTLEAFLAGLMRGGILHDVQEVAA